MEIPPAMQQQASHAAIKPCSILNSALGAPLAYMRHSGGSRRDAGRQAAKCPNPYRRLSVVPEDDLADIFRQTCSRAGKTHNRKGQL